MYKLIIKKLSEVFFFLNVFFPNETSPNNTTLPIRLHAEMLYVILQILDFKHTTTVQTSCIKVKKYKTVSTH